MKENRLAILLGSSFSIVIFCYLLVDYAARFWTEETDEFVSNVFCFGIALFFVVCPAVFTHIARVAHLRKIASICKLFTFIAVANLIQELNGEGSKLATVFEYVFAVVGIPLAILEYHRIKTKQVLLAILKFTKTKFNLCLKYLSASWKKTRK